MREETTRVVYRIRIGRTGSTHYVAKDAGGIHKDAQDFADLVLEMPTYSMASAFIARRLGHDASQTWRIVSVTKRRATSTRAVLDAALLEYGQSSRLSPASFTIARSVRAWVAVTEACKERAKYLAKKAGKRSYVP